MHRVVMQKVRQRGQQHFHRVLSAHDIIVTPTTPAPAPAIPASAFTGGDLNLSRAAVAMRFMAPANLLGLPSISLPVGATASGGLPLGCGQLVTLAL